MVAYFICLIIVVWTTWLAHKTRLYKAYSNFYILISFLVLVLVAGLRAESVGTDTSSYVRHYKNLNGAVESVFNSSFEVGFQTLEYISINISQEYWVFLTLIAFVTVSLYLKAIYCYSNIPYVSVLVFITLGYYTFFFNGARQGIACAFYALSIGAMINGKFLKYLIIVLVASLFHKTALITIPFYFLFRQKFSYNKLAVIVLLSLVSIFSFAKLIGFGTNISSKYEVYKSMEATGGESLTLFYVILCAFFILMRKEISRFDLKYYDIFLNMLIAGSVIFVVVIFSKGYVELTRIAFYFHVGVLFLWPLLFRNIRSFKQEIGTAFFIGHISYFFIFISQMGDLYPYKINSLFSMW